MRDPSCGRGICLERLPPASVVVTAPPVERILDLFGRRSTPSRSIFVRLSAQTHTQKLRSRKRCRVRKTCTEACANASPRAKSVHRRNARRGRQLSRGGGLPPSRNRPSRSEIVSLCLTGTTRRFPRKTGHSRG